MASLPLNRYARAAGFLAVTILGLSPLAASASDLPVQKIMPVFSQRIAYYDVGSGPLLVLIHGAGSSAATDWGTCIPELAKHHRVLAPDLLGFGHSDKPLIDFGIQTWVDTLGEFLRLARAKDFTLAGESLGGWISLQYTLQAQRPQNIGLFALPRPVRLVLSDAAGHRKLMEHSGQSDGSVTSLASSRGLLGAIFSDPGRQTDEAVRAGFALTLSKGDGWTLRSLFTNRAILAEAVDDQIPQIAVPTLVIWGAEDHIIPLEDGKDFATRIPGARLVVIPHAGHAPEIEQAGPYLAAFLPFVDASSSHP